MSQVKQLVRSISASSQAALGALEGRGKQAGVGEGEKARDEEAQDPADNEISPTVDLLLQFQR